MPLDWQPLLNTIRSHQTFLLTCHMRPDGDALGSILSLGEALTQQGKTVHLVLPSPLPPRYEFIRKTVEVTEFEPVMQSHFALVETIIVMDTGTWNQLGKLGDFIKKSSAKKFVIDHHLTQDDLGAMRFVDVSAESCCRLSWELINAMQATITPRIAENIFMGLSMDTGWFRHSNTNTQSFALATQLTAAGAPIDQLHKRLYDSNTLGRQKLQGFVLQNLKMAHDNRTCYAKVMLSDYQALGARPADTEDMVNLTMSVQGVEVGLVFLEQLANGGTKVSLRSKGGLSIRPVAEQFGGGGHAAASGVIMKESVDSAMTKVLDAVGKLYQTG